MFVPPRTLMCLLFYKINRVVLLLSRLFPSARHVPTAASPPLLPPVALRHAEPKEIFIALSKAEGQGLRFTIEDQNAMDRLLLQSPGSLGLIDRSSDSDGEVAVTQFEGLTDGHTYRMAHDRTDRLTTLEGGVQTRQGTLKNIDEALESDVSVVVKRPFELPPFFFSPSLLSISVLIPPHFSLFGSPALRRSRLCMHTWWRRTATLVSSSSSMRTNIFIPRRLTAHS